MKNIIGHFDAFNWTGFNIVTFYDVDYMTTQHYAMVVLEFNVQTGKVYAQCYDEQDNLLREDVLYLLLAPTSDKQ